MVDRVVPVHAVGEAVDAARGDVELEREAPAGRAGGAEEVQRPPGPLGGPHDAGGEEQDPGERGEIEPPGAQLATGQRVAGRGLHRRPLARQLDRLELLPVALDRRRPGAGVVLLEVLADQRVVLRRLPVLPRRLVGREPVVERDGLAAQSAASRRSRSLSSFQAPTEARRYGVRGRLRMTTPAAASRSAVAGGSGSSQATSVVASRRRHRAAPLRQRVGEPRREPRRPLVHGVEPVALQQLVEASVNADASRDSDGVS